MYGHLFTIFIGLIFGFILNKGLNLDTFSKYPILMLMFIPSFIALFIVSILISIKFPESVQVYVKCLFLGISISLTFLTIYKIFQIILYYSPDPIALAIRRHIRENPMDIDAYFNLVRSLLFISIFGLLERLISMTTLLKKWFNIDEK